MKIKAARAKIYILIQNVLSKITMYLDHLCFQMDLMILFLLTLATAYPIPPEPETQQNSSEKPATSLTSAKNLGATLAYVLAGEPVELFDESLVTNTRVAIGAHSLGDGFKGELELLEEVVTRSFEQSNIKYNKREGDRLRGKTEILETLHEESLDNIKRTGLYLGTIKNYFKGEEQQRLLAAHLKYHQLG